MHDRSNKIFAMMMGFRKKSLKILMIQWIEEQLGILMFVQVCMTIELKYDSEVNILTLLYTAMSKEEQLWCSRETLTTKLLFEDCQQRSKLWMNIYQLLKLKD